MKKSLLISTTTALVSLAASYGTKKLIQYYLDKREERGVNISLNEETLES